MPVKSLTLTDDHVKLNGLWSIYKGKFQVYLSFYSKDGEKSLSERLELPPGYYGPAMASVYMNDPDDLLKKKWVRVFCEHEDKANRMIVYRWYPATKTLKLVG